MEALVFCVALVEVPSGTAFLLVKRYCSEASTCSGGFPLC